MRFSVDAHAIGRHLTGNEVYIRNLLQGFAALDQSSEFIAYLSHNVNGAEAAVPHRFARRYVSANSFKRLGLDLSRRLAEDRPDLVHVQYTAPSDARLRSWSAFTTSASWSILNTSPGCGPSNSG